MEQIQRNQERYSLPFIVHSSYKIRMHILFLFMIIMFIGFSLLPTDDLFGIVYQLFCFILGLLFIYCWVYMGVLKKSYLELTKEGVSLKTIFISKKLKWIDIADVQTYSLQGNSYIGIITNKELIKRKDNFLTSLSVSFGGGYSLSIPLASFSTIDSQKLYSTIFYTAQEKLQQRDNKEDNESDTTKEAKKEMMLVDTPVKALIKAFIVSLITGIIYGLCIYQFNINFLIIPILGMMGIMYVYFKNYQKHNINLITRLVLGILCAMQFYIALLVVLLILNRELIGTNGIWQTIIDCTIYILEHPEEFMRYYLFGVMIFFIGIFQGYSSKTTRRIRKYFMRKQNGFIIKREKRYVSIFLTDYIEYNENEDKSILSIIPNVCLIEKEKNNILAFYIPEQLVIDFNINISRLDRTFVRGEMYYKLDLGGHAEQQTYGYMCNLILNKDRQIELIQLEID